MSSSARRESNPRHRLGKAVCAPSHRRRIAAGAVRPHGPSRRSDLNAVLVEQLVIVQHHRPTSFPLFQVVGVFRGRGRRYSTLAPARIGWARPACQGGRSGYGPKALGRLFRSHRVHASRRLEQRAQRAIPVWSRSAGVERPDGGGAVVGGREAPGAVAVEPSVLHHTFGKQTVGAVARPLSSVSSGRRFPRAWTPVLHVGTRPYWMGAARLPRRPERVWSQGSRPPFSFAPGACVPEARTARPTGDSSLEPVGRR